MGFCDGVSWSAQLSDIAESYFINFMNILLLKEEIWVMMVLLKSYHEGGAYGKDTIIK